MIEGVYTPSEWGIEYSNLPHDEALGAGAAGPGKSFVLLMEPFGQILTDHKRCQQSHKKLLEDQFFKDIWDTRQKNPELDDKEKKKTFHLQWGMSKGVALHLRREMSMLKDTIDRSLRIFPRVDKGAVYNKSDMTWTLSSGFKYEYGHCKDPGDFNKYMSREFTIVLFDELTQFLEDQYDNIITRCRTDDPVLQTMLKIRSMSNPLIRKSSGDTFSIENPHWVREKFVDPQPKGKVTLFEDLYRKDGSFSKRKTWIYLPATLYHNPDKEFVRTYEARLLGSKPHIRQALLYGDWYITPGSYYADAWNKQMHVCRPFLIPDDWPWVRSMDWGFKKPGCVHWGVLDPDDTLWIVREMTFTRKTDKQVAEQMQIIEKKLGLWSGGRSSISGPADDQLWEQRGDTGLSKAAMFSMKGIDWAPANKKSRMDNAQRIYGRLEDHDHGQTRPGLVIFDSCAKLIKTLPAIQAEDGNPDIPVDGGEDHWHDSLGYMCAFVSRGRSGLRSKLDLEEDFWDDEPEADRGSYGYGAEPI